ncbi:MAG: response regulator transcription factor [Sulfurimonas sp.]|nr:response regulator transcription factor [Sulfurimonas sp.]MDD3834944.1 response regulator transcription factor [Sulfurimonas sp.]
MRILIIEDDNKMRAMLSDALAPFYTVDALGSLEESYVYIESFVYEALLLDRNLSGVDEGMEIIPKLKKLQPSCAVMIASAYGGVEERIAGLSAGADDYLEKPYDLRELKMRIDALVYRHAPDIIEIDGLYIDIKLEQLRYEQQLLHLSKKEHDLLFFLAAHPDKILTRDDIANAIYNDPTSMSSNTIDVIISNIRKKLPINPIETLKGRGYALKNI